jgi:hypothetical protein
MTGIARWNGLKFIRAISKTRLSFQFESFNLLEPLEFLAELAIGSDPVAVSDKCKGNDRDSKTEECNKTACPGYTEPVEHGLGS